ncbi:polysaccharide biosynthesis C-terminal domain-containing protein [uncultured Vagococcus sp.]|uniref:lipopolysaccharide biosynthesis protein n=1 Tax=uncultured Vagococcus sp. TaxID=189676 RepID=UPI0028CFDCE8|nr:polysaccharide biosynthesis C-terminal domain-containing protein [uncultured Vagococcus sp.]
MMNQPVKKLVTNTIIFGMGNIGSKLIGFLLLPLYTGYLTTVEYGNVDLVTMFANLLLPVTSLCLYEGILRFTLEKGLETEKLFATGLIVNVFMCQIVIVISWFTYQQTSNQLVLFTSIIVVVQVIQNFLGQFIRGIGLVKIYSFNGFLMGIILAVGNIICMVRLDLGLIGYMIAWVGSYLVSVLFFLFFCPIKGLFNSKNYNVELLKMLLTYSFPLILNATLMWLINVSNRLLVYYLVGESASGIFAIAYKLPMILETFYLFFFQAWQISAIEVFSEKNISDYFSSVFQYVSFGLLSLLSLIVMLIKPIMAVFIGENFYEAWQYVPILLVGVVFSCFASFIGTIYSASKRNVGMFVSTFIGAITSVLLSLILVPSIGMIGAAIAHCFTMLTVWLYRVKDTKKWCRLLYHSSLFKTLAIIGIQVTVVTLDMTNGFLLNGIFFLLILVVNRRSLAVFLVKS